MAFRLYLVPIVGVGTKADPRRPKYFADGSLASNPSWSGMDYGIEKWMMVAADLSTADDLFVTGQADGFALPFDLSQPMTAQQVTNVQNKLEAINLPAGWIDTTFTWQSMLRIVLGILSFMQRFSALNGNVSLFTGGVTLGTKINQLPAGVVTNLQQAAADMKLSTANITGNTTIRAALKDFGTQLNGRPYSLNGMVI